MKQRSSNIVPAAVLIVVGLFFLLNNLGLLDNVDLSLKKLWPGLLVLGGLAFWLQYLLERPRDPGLVLLGTAMPLLGLFFFLFTLELELPFEFETVSGPLDWSDNAHLWPAYPLIGGIAFVTMSLLSGKKDDLFVGFVAIAVGVAASFFTLGRPDELGNLVRFWPLLLIALGLWGLLQMPLRRMRD